ncbi:MAG: phosphoglucosamine mutase [Acidimicrobiales bacterium]|nr:phosphoglucosamine mutase [Acidimicrobiales bacterium]
MRFGTDGIRGRALDELTPELAARIGRAAARVLRGPRVLIGADTRESGPQLVAALAAGIAAEGVDPEWLGVVPTPAVAHLCAVHGLPGAVVSASHNPWHDNGIKVFGPGGLKLNDADQAALEAVIDSVDVPGALPAAPPAPAELTSEYVTHLIAALEGRSLAGQRVVLDCANGAASELAPDVFRAAGAAVDAIHASPDGRNINAACGSTHLDAVARRVLETGAELGLAFDGDADRVLAVDHRGDVVDGDHLLAICATDLRSRGQLRRESVVITVMTNLGFRLAMRDAGIDVIEVPVGDRHVLAALDEHGLSLGGEQSGHVIFRDLATTGDGLLTGLQLCSVVARSGVPLAELASAAMTRLPQLLCNVAGTPDLVVALEPYVRAAAERLGDTGRVLVRASGTEPVVRLMVEAPTEEVAQATIDELVAASAGVGFAGESPS